MTQDDPPTGTRADLIAAGLHLFGKQGFAATPTRALAALAKTNVASIAYHFGSKEGLRLACGAEVARRIGQVTGPPATQLPATQGEALDRLEAMLRAMVVFLTQGPQAQDTVAFILRELSEGGPTFDLVYDAFFLPKHRELCALTGMATGQPAEADETRLLVFSLLGQAVYFRIGQPVICRRMGWTGYSAAETKAIADRLAANLRAILHRSLP
ncbi:DUF1956 domain-containing protein [Gemmobacter lutimaris]|uniref:DUF1956 domain-containing protein n=1 Tax=Gemmobacter lutimaris TaxID=2306023 RepID=A0A398BPH5_9RHOB|nr:CerR family C-terminal domain-containing protein [Gemmobacter lutimaris]RID90811.1 DUF1956 domain-containing protein [Gemmobacter lutimaris]